MPNTLAKENISQLDEAAKESFADTESSHWLHTATHGSLLLGFGISLSIFGILSGKIALWDIDGPILASSLRGPAASGIVLLLIGAAIALRKKCFDNIFFLYGSSLGLLLFFFSDWMVRNYSLLKGPSIRGEIILGTLLCAFCLHKIGRKWSSILFLPLGISVIFYNFASTVKHRLILGDDHSVFLHRLSLLKENFPFIPTYDTSWNGGLDSLHIFATGVLNIFFIYAPLIYRFPIENTYSALVGTTLFGLVPLCSYCATRYFRLPASTACIAAILSITQGLFFYRWGLVYGTMGFITACAFLPLVFSLFYRFLDEPESFSAKNSLILFVTCSLMLCWPLSGLPFVVIAAMLLWNIKAVLKNKKFLAAGISVLLVTLPWVYVLWSGWNVKSFISAKKPATHASAETTSKFKGTVFRAHVRHVGVEEAVKILREQESPTSPLLIVLALPGIFLLQKRAKYIFCATALWLLGLACIGSPLKPQLELERMLLMLSCLCVIPTALAIDTLWKSKNRSNIFRQGTAILAGGFLFAGLVSTASMVANRRHEQAHFATPAFFDLANTLTSHARGGRALFSGFTLHELNQGHLAPLSHFTKTPMIARSHVHNVWQYRDVIPEEYRSQGAHGIETFLDLWNVSLVTAHDPVWRKYFRSHPDRYSEISTHGRFVVFARNPFPDNYFVQGQGSIVEQNTSNIVLKTQSSNVVIKFRYNKFLEVSGCSSIAPHEIDEDLSFIALEGCRTDYPIRIATQGFWGRISNFGLQLSSKVTGGSA